MKRNSERGVALVITLIMLALVTSMAVVFLAVSRREKASVTITADIATSRAMADAATARAQVELVSRMLTSTNPFDYDVLVSTNYENTAGFQPGVASPFNVNFQRRRNGSAMTAGNTDWLRNIANLQIDPRAPVFIGTNLTGLRTNDFRFYLDLNRNGLFEPTGYIPAQANEGPKGLSNYFVGDPQWIGVLARPDLPHSESNQFVGRYTFMVVPTGKALDINYIHNYAKKLRNDLSVDGYFRNQGVGSWEINLAGFLTGLNSNAWPRTFYNYNPALNSSSSGAAFEDARAILRFRYERDLTKLASARALFNFPANPNNPFATNGIDYYSDGPVVSLAPDATALPWSGSYNPNGYYDIQELFDTNKTSAQFVQRLMNVSTLPTATPYNRYTYYRLLSQLTTDSRPPESNKVYFADYRAHYTNRLHLLYQNFVPNGQTNFIPWNLNTFSRTAFFHAAADRLLRASLDPLVLTNASRLQTNFMLGLTPVRNTFCCTNIQLHHIDAGRLASVPFYVTNNEYSSTLHRLLQVAVNLHDATTVQNLGTTNDYPTVFRPVFVRSATNLVINGFVEETNTVFLTYPWMTIEQAAVSSALPLNQPLVGLNLYDVPLVIGAKKGYPNFNKFVVQTMTDISRRLEIRRNSPVGPPSETNQMYVIGVSNRVAVEGWNSYQTDFNRNLEIRVAGRSAFALHHKGEGQTVEYPPVMTSWPFTNSLTTNRWAGSVSLSAQNSFIVPVDTNLTALANSVYLARNGAVLPLQTNIFERSFRVPQWTLRLTNRLQYVVIDHSAKPVPRIIDYVNLDKLTSEINLNQGLTGSTNAGAGGMFSDQKPGARVASLGPGDMWLPQRAGKSLDSPSQGVLNQIGVASGIPYTGAGTWRDESGQVQDKQNAIQRFKDFLAGGKVTNLTWQVPFTPSRRLYQKSSWEANDPLVHYTAEDLTDPMTVVSTNVVVQPLEGTDVAIRAYIQNDSFVRQLNPRYRPWGGNPNKDPNNDTTAYALTVKDPLVRRSDDWHFPTNKFPNIGWLGRVHRGTPWQTMYLKAPIDPRTRQPLELRTWALWSGSFGTHPTNDWKLLDLFTVAPNDNASRGLLSVNQTNTAAWSAVLSGITVVSNSLPDAAAGPGRVTQYRDVLVQPETVQLEAIIDGINRTHSGLPTRTYRTVGEVLAVPELTVLSPYLNLSRRQTEQGIDDAAYERIPQQIMSLLRTDEPRVTIYAFGQSLKPADRSLVTAPGYFNLCTNYQITGEFATKTVVRLEELTPESTSRSLTAPVAQKMKAVVESYSVLQPD